MPCWAELALPGGAGEGLPPLIEALLSTHLPMETCAPMSALLACLGGAEFGMILHNAVCLYYVLDMEILIYLLLEIKFYVIHVLHFKTLKNGFWLCVVTH